MPTPITPNEEPAEALIPGGLILVLSTTPQPSWKKDQRNDLVHYLPARV